MARKKDGSRTEITRVRSGTALVPVAAGANGLTRIEGGDVGGGVFRQEGVTLVAGRPYDFGGRAVVADAVYYVGDDGAGRPGGSRLGGADKVAWRDEATGYECIVMREPKGFLRGFVGVEPGHPLYGFDHQAIPSDLDVEVHGGVTYSAICQEGPSPARRLLREARSICHVVVAALYADVESATGHRPGHDAAWWLGFSCDQLYDEVARRPNEPARFLASETGARRRDEAYVYDQVVHLAAQLRAIADGAPRPARVGVAPPPIGLDPGRAG